MDWEAGHALQESFGEFINPLEYLFDDPSFTSTPFGHVINPVALRDDRADGRYRPVYETEQQLAFIRRTSHVLTEYFGSAINVMTNLNNYTISSGFDYEVKPIDKATQLPDEIFVKNAVDYVLKSFFDDNDWKADLETETHNRSREDGETLLALKPNGWRTEASIFEPDQLTQPSNPRELEDWLRECWCAAWVKGGRRLRQFMVIWRAFNCPRCLSTARLPLCFRRQR